MKKLIYKLYLLLLLFLLCLFSFQNVNAVIDEVELTVCSSHCQYRTLGQVLSDIERYGK